MDDAIRASIEASITKLLHDFPKGLTTSALTDEIDEAEAPLQVSTVLNDMGRRGLVAQDKQSKMWCWVADANGSSSTLPPAPEKKRHETAEAILDAFVGRQEGCVIAVAELNKICSKWSVANVGYHIKALRQAGLLVAAKNGKGYSLASAKPAARAKPPVRRPNTALIPSGADLQPAPAAIPPAATEPVPALVHDITLELTCPAGRLKIDGTPKLVFGFIEQLKELAA